MLDGTWRRTVEIKELLERPRVFKSSPHQLALFHQQGRYFAIDNRCPHEGYPLVEGTVDDQCVLTCNWHNWKFQLEDGECTLGGDHVRSYEVRVDDGYLWVNLEERSPEEVWDATLQGLRTAYDERDYGRICRELTRLRVAGLDAFAAISQAIDWSYDRLEYGMTHAYAATADWLALAKRFPDDWERQLVCLAESIDHMAFDALRHREYPFPATENEILDGGDLIGFEAEFRTEFAKAIENEDVKTAESLVGEALARGASWKHFELPLAAAALAHYNDFGHSLIYVYKASQLIEILGPEVLGPLTRSVARSIGYATREDLIPEFSAYGAAISTFPQVLGQGKVTETPVFPSSLREILEWVDRQSEASAASIYDELLKLLARNLLHFNLEYDQAFAGPVSENVGWLDFTHGVTFANAVRAICSRHVELWPAGLLQMACFVGRNRQFVDRDLDVASWRIDDESAFWNSAYDTILDHGIRQPIFSAHLIKTAVAVEEEVACASQETQSYLLAGLNRFLHSPIKQKHTRRLARQAMRLVEG